MSQVMFSGVKIVENVMVIQRLTPINSSYEGGH